MAKIGLPCLFGYTTRIPLSRMTANNSISPMIFCYTTSFNLSKQSLRSRDLSYKMDLDVWDCFGRKNIEI